MTALMQAALADFGTDVTLLEQPTLQQLEQGLKSLQVRSAPGTECQAAAACCTGPICVLNKVSAGSTC